MSFEVFFSDSNGTTTLDNLGSAADRVFVDREATLVVRGDEVFTMNGSDAEMTINGTIVSDHSQTISSSSTESSITVGSTGSILNTSGDNFGYAISMFNAASMTVTNHGTLSGSAGIATSSGQGQTIVNTGTISSDGSGSFVAGIYLIGGGSAGFTSIINSGEIIGGKATGGTSGLNVNAIFAGTSFTDQLQLDNSGTIAGLVQLGDGTDFVTNSGTMTGNVDTQDGEDFVTNAGIIQGSVSLGNGQNTYEGVGSGVVLGFVQGGFDRDIMFGGDLADKFRGFEGNDIMRAGDGDDQLVGGDGIDQLFGDNGNDSISGGSEADRLFGGNGNDTISGNSGADILRGGDGNDSLEGGSDRDVSFGGAGRDVFIFSAVSDSLAGSSTRDAIRDFERGEDFIDLEDIAGGGLRYIGTSAFSGSGPEVRHVTTAAGSSIVRVDVDGDGTRDMEILVQFTPTLTEDDFLL